MTEQNQDSSERPQESPISEKPQESPTGERPQESPTGERPQESPTGERPQPSQAGARPQQRQTGTRPQSQSGARPQQRRRGGGRRRYTRRPRICQFCADKTIVIGYKQIDLIRRYVSESGKIRPRRETGACARHQRKVARAIKRARHMALLPFAAENYR